MGNEKRPPAPDGADSPAKTEETTGKGDEASPDGAGSAVPTSARPRNGAGRDRTIGRKIKEYVN